MYNAHPHFSLRNLGKISGKIRPLPRSFSAAHPPGPSARSERRPSLADVTYLLVGQQPRGRFFHVKHINEQERVLSTAGASPSPSIPDPWTQPRRRLLATAFGHHSRMLGFRCPSSATGLPGVKATGDSRRRVPSSPKGHFNNF